MEQRQLRSKCLIICMTSIPTEAAGWIFVEGKQKNYVLLLTREQFKAFEEYGMITALH